jgi:hypothetical protein
MVSMTLLTNEKHITLMQSNAVFVNVVHEVCVLQVWQIE